MSINKGDGDGEPGDLRSPTHITDGGEKGAQDTAPDAGLPAPGCCDTASLVLFATFSGLAFVAAAVAVGSGGAWTAILDRHDLRSCTILNITAIVPVIVGAITLAVVMALLFAAFATSRGKPFAGLTPYACLPWRALRIALFHVLPAILFLACTALAILAFWFSTMAAQQPDLGRNFGSVAGLSGAVTITRDANGLAHISAQSRGDAYFGQGLAQAQDRLWQIEFQRLAALGRLAEFVGPAAKKVDRQVRILGFHTAAKAMCRNLDATDRTLFQRYVDGINFYLQQFDERPPEFLFMSKRLMFFHQPEPFTVEHVCSALTLLMWQLGTNLEQETNRFNIFWKTNRTFDEVVELFTNQTNMTNPIFSAAEMGYSEADAVAARQREAADEAIERSFYDGHMTALRASKGAGLNTPGIPKLNRRSSGDGRNNRPAPEEEATFAAPTASDADAEWDIRNFQNLHASNAWASRAAGMPSVGASDPHLGLNAPSVWYPAHLSWPENSTHTFDITGVGMAGIPGVHIAQTSHISWGITMSITDLQDLFIITPDATNPDTHYVVNGTARPYTTRRETIEVLGGSSESFTVRETIYGPVATEALELPASIVFAFYYRPFVNDSRSAHGLLCTNDPATNTAAKLRDSCFSQLEGPGLSIPITDASGNLVYSLTGFHPNRNKGHTGRFPMPGNGSFDYLGVIAFTDLPTTSIPSSVTDATSRYIGVGNQRITADGYRFNLGYDFVYPFRGGRIHDLLRSNPTQLSNATFHRTVQTDLYSNMAAEWLQLLNETARPEVAAFHSALTAVGTDRLARLRGWDRSMAIGGTLGSLFWLWARELHSTPRDAIAAADFSGRTYWQEFDYALRQLKGPSVAMTAWCKQRVAGATGCGDMAGKLLNTIAFNNERWGHDLNHMRLRHLMMHGSALECLFERSGPKSGDWSTVGVSDFQFQDNMKISYASSQIYDWADPKFGRDFQQNTSHPSQRPPIKSLGTIPGLSHPSRNRAEWFHRR